MTTNRKQTKNGARWRIPTADIDQGRLDRRRAQMQAAEEANVGHRRNEWERLLGH